MMYPCESQYRCICMMYPCESQYRCICMMYPCESQYRCTVDDLIMLRPKKFFLRGEV